MTMDSPFYYLVRNEGIGRGDFTYFLTAYDAAVYAAAGQSPGVVTGKTKRPSEGTEGVDYVIYSTWSKRL